MRAGDHIVADRGLYLHHGIALDRHRLIHYAGDPLRWRDACIEVVGLDDFARDDDVFCVDSPRRFSRSRVVQRARTRLGERRYNLLTNNCEHFARWARSGTAVSLQVEERARQTCEAGAWLAERPETAGTGLFLQGLGQFIALLQKR